MAQESHSRGVYYIEANFTIRLFLTIDITIMVNF